MTSQTTDMMYDTSKPNAHPLQWVEIEHTFSLPQVPDLKMIAFGAYNAFGLIGPEKGGLAIVVDGDKKFIIATFDIGYSMRKRAEAFERVKSEIEGMDNATPQRVYDYLKRNRWQLR